MSQFRKGNKVVAKFGRLEIAGRVSSGPHLYTPTERRTLARIGGFIVPPKTYYLIRWQGSMLLAAPCRNARRA